jgi:hypothetical protein
MHVCVGLHCSINMSEPALVNMKACALNNAITPWKQHPTRQLHVLTLKKTCYEEDYEHYDCGQLCDDYWGILLADKHMIARLEVDAYRVRGNPTYDAYELRNLEYVLKSVVLWESFTATDDNGVKVQYQGYSVPACRTKINILESAASKHDWLEWSFYVNICDSLADTVEFVKKEDHIIDNVSYSLTHRHFGWWIY